MKTELIIGISSLVLCISILCFVEYNHIRQVQTSTIMVSLEDAQSQVKSELDGDQGFVVEFQSELNTKYYFKALNDDTGEKFDVYVDKREPGVIVLPISTP